MRRLPIGRTLYFGALVTVRTYLVRLRTGSVASSPAFSPPAVGPHVRP